MENQSIVYKECSYKPEINRSLMVESRYRKASKTPPRPPAPQSPEVDEQAKTENRAKLTSFLARMKQETARRENKRVQLERKKREDEDRELERMRSLAQQVYSESYVRNYGREIPDHRHRQRRPREEPSDPTDQSQLVLDESICLNFRVE